MVVLIVYSHRLTSFFMKIGVQKPKPSSSTQRNKKINLIKLNKP